MRPVFRWQFMHRLASCSNDQFRASCNDDLIVASCAAYR